MKIAVISEGNSDFSDILTSFGAELMLPHNASSRDLTAFSACCILGGTFDEPFRPSAALRNQLDIFAQSGKPLFVEYCSGFLDLLFSKPVPTEYRRLVAVADIDDIAPGDLLDDHANRLCAPSAIYPDSQAVMLSEAYVQAHDHVDIPPSSDFQKWAIWYMHTNILVSGIRLCNFNRARFAPRLRWHTLIRFILHHILGTDADYSIYPSVWLACDNNEVLNPEKTAEKALHWCNTQLEANGKNGVREGLSHNILPNGKQLTSDVIRADCTGEVGGAFMLHALRTGNRNDLEIYRNTADFIFSSMQIHSGINKGMIRWSEEGWGICYADDVARAVIPTLMYIRLTGDTIHLQDVCSAMDFLVSSTGTDGLRIRRTDIIHHGRTELDALHTHPGAFPSAHFNAWYHAALLLTYQLTGNSLYRDTALSGLASIMAVFPDTIREHSETQELCRLILPLAERYRVTGEQKHLLELDKVADMLFHFADPSGSYREWDSGYKSFRSRMTGSECSLLAENGDPVSDLLYSVNWLAPGFAAATEITREPRFRDALCALVRFFCNCQQRSLDPSIDGSWPRGIDLSRMENYGVPHDTGWGPCCVESGWTVGEITMGIEYALLRNLL